MKSCDGMISGLSGLALPRMRAALSVLVTLLVVVGCGVSQTRVLPPEELPFPAKVATRSELIEILRKTGESVRTLTARVTLVAAGGAMTTGALTSYRETNGTLIVRRPNHIRLKGEAPLALATVFDMVSDGELFRVSVPIRNTFITGDNTAVTKEANPVLNLRPQHVMEALFVDVREYLANPRVLAAMEQQIEGRRSFYVFSFIDGSLSNPQMIERVWIDRRNFTVARKQVFGADGVIQTDVDYESYQALPGVTFPKSISIKRPLEDYSVKITFVRTIVNETLPEDAFFLAAPPGAEVIRVGEIEGNRF